MLVAIETQTDITVGFEEDLVVIPSRIVQPRGEDFVGDFAQSANSARKRAVGGLPRDIFESAAPSSGRKPPMSSNFHPHVPTALTPARERHPGPLYLHSPGLSPIPARDEQEKEVAAEEGNRGAKCDASGANISPTVDVNQEEFLHNDGDAQKDNENVGTQYGVLSARALNGEFERSVNHDEDDSTAGSHLGADEDESLQMLSLLTTETSDIYDKQIHNDVRRANASFRAISVGAAAATAVAEEETVPTRATHRNFPPQLPTPTRSSSSPKFFGAGTVFSIAIDKEGTPVIVPLEASPPPAPATSAGMAGTAGLPFAWGQHRPTALPSFTSFEYHQPPVTASPGESPTLFSLLRPLQVKPALSSPTGLGSQYWKDRLRRRQISSILGSPTLRNIF